MSILIPQEVITPEVEAIILMRQIDTALNNLRDLYFCYPEAVIDVHSAIKRHRETLTKINADIIWRKTYQKLGKVR
jgi:hypothetical protein